jgi:hypothetical protein
MKTQTQTPNQNPNEWITKTLPNKGKGKPNALLVNPNLEKVQTFVPSLSEKEAQKVAKALNELEKASNSFSLKTLNYGKDAILNYSSRAKILDFVKEQTKLKYDELSKLTNISVSYLKSFAQLSKAINSADEGKSIDTFLIENVQRVESQKPTNYTIYGLISYLKGEDIFADKGLQKISDKDEAKEQTKANKTQTKAQTKAQTTEPKADANKQTFIFNPLLFGFDSKEDIMLSITHSPKNTAKPYLIVSSVNSAVLRSMFDKICFELGKCERDLEEIEKKQNKSKQAAIQDILETETELADDVTLDTFESEYMQVRK